jgi:hypothetical protein
MLTLLNLNDQPRIASDIRTRTWQHVLHTYVQTYGKHTKQYTDSTPQLFVSTYGSIPQRPTTVTMLPQRLPSPLYQTSINFHFAPIPSPSHRDAQRTPL